MRESLSKTFRVTEIGSNIAIVSLAMLLGYVLLSRYIIDSPSPPPREAAENIQPRAKLPQIDTGWDKSENNFLLILSTTCKYCTESLPFYKKLGNSKSSGEARLIAAFSQDRDEAAEYLASAQVAVDEIIQTAPDYFNVRGTPTLLLVDRDGIVKAVWEGKLAADEENEVLARLAGARGM